MCELTCLEAKIADLEGEHRETVDRSLLGDIQIKLEESHEVVQSEENHIRKYVTTRAHGEEEHPEATLAILEVRGE
ncbi:hypothetical protein NDU88_003463 [Pleurodeles waltl]|uniref:Uncharacterized protein n=1 Tax=Pleurodeles waltl TaxID=8319 RepID=A0AAV7T6I9_PLEWA|nr:hypothetical protein NDU88_003463 [Pleurodeles waltl]